MKQLILTFCRFAFILWMPMGHGLYSQKINTFTVQHPTDIAGDYAVAQAEWGDTSVQSLSARAVFASPVLGCEAYANDYSDKIVFMEKGTCTYDMKALNAQIDGAIAVVICNNNLSSEPLYLIPPGDTSSQVYIPVFLTDKQTCDKLKIYLTGNGLDMSLQYKCAKPIYSEKVVWGKAIGEGDFSNGFDGWTVDKGWTYNREGIIRKGAYTGNPKIVGSATACTGVAEFNSDHLDNNSDKNSSGQGECPAPCTGSLISPAIILEKPLKGLVIEFTQTLREFRSEYNVLCSFDGGLTYTDPIKINTHYNPSISHSTERIKIPIPGFAGKHNVRVKFEITGNYYYWAIDDIVLIDEIYYDLSIVSKNLSVAPFYKMPKSQISEIPLMYAMEYKGNEEIVSSKINCIINGPSQMDTLSETLPVISPYSTKEEVLKTNIFLPSEEVGKYQLEYEVFNQNDLNPTNNSNSFLWEITDCTFGTLANEKEFGSEYLFHQDPAWLALVQTKNKTFGNVYYVPNGQGFAAEKVRFGIGNDLDYVYDQAVRIDLFEFTDINSDHYCQPDERKKVGGAFVILNDSIENMRNIEVPVWQVDESDSLIIGSKVSLKNNMHYLISGTTIVRNEQTFKDFYLLYWSSRSTDPYSNSISNLQNTIRAFDTLDVLNLLPHRTSSSIVSIYGNYVNDKDLEGLILSPFLGPDIRVFMELDICEHSVNTTNENIELVMFNIFPNPTSRELFIDFNLSKTSKKVEVSIYTTEGKLVSTKTYSHILDDRIKLDVSTFINGVYTVRINTDEGVATRKIVIQN